MRILIDATAVNDGGGGICTFLLGLLSGWKSAAFDDELRIIGMAALPKAVDELVSPPGTVRRLGAPSSIRRVAAQQLVLPALGRKPSWRPHIIFATTPVIPIVHRRTPIVAMVHDLRSIRLPREFGTITRGYRRVAYVHGLLRADGIVTNSDFTRREVESVTGYRCSKPRVVYLGADHVDQWPLSPTTGIHGLTFAHWSNKRPDVAIRAWALLRRRNPEFAGVLHVVGARPLDDAGLTALSTQLHMGDLVRIHSFLLEREYRELFRSSSIVLLPTTMEGFGLPVAEAQRLGIPVVASAVGGVVEVGGDAALYSSTSTAESFADLCASVLFDPACRRDLIARGRNQASNFTWQRTAHAVRDELVATVGRSRHSARKP